MRPINMSALVSLDSLARDINAEHCRVLDHASKAIEHARRAGEWLLKAKAQVKHGEWLPWLQANVPFSHRTAQGYIRVAKNFPKLEGKANAVAHLSLRGALKALASPVMDGSPESEAEAYADAMEAMKIAVVAGKEADRRRRAIAKEHAGIISACCAIKTDAEERGLDWSVLRDPSEPVWVIFEFAFCVEENMDPLGDHFMEIRERLEPARLEFLEVIASEAGKARMRAVAGQRLSNA